MKFDWLMKVIRILLIISILLIFQEQYFFNFLINKGIYYHHLTGGMAIVGIAVKLLKKEVSIKSDAIIRSVIVFLLAILLTCFFSSDIIESLKFFLVVLYGVSFYLSILIAFKDVAIERIITTLCWSIILATFIAIYDLVAINNGFVILSQKPDGSRMTSLFQFFGNTADFAQIMLSILIPYACVTFSVKSIKKNSLLLIAIVAGTLLLVGSSRVSVIISFTVSIILLMIINFKFVKVKSIVLVGLFSTLVISVFFAFYPRVLQELLYRVQMRITNRQPNTLAGDFFLENINTSLRIFYKNPITGVGLGNSKILVNTQSFSVHGTFFRLLSETGIIGCIGFLILLFYIFRFVIQNISHYNRQQSYFYQFTPFLIGIIISSVYNIHFFRIEFWLFLATIQLISKYFNSVTQK